MFDFEPTDEQRVLIDARPADSRANESSRSPPQVCDRESRFPKDVFDQALRDRSRQPHLCLPSTAARARAISIRSSIPEELAYGCSGIQTSMTANTLALTPIVLAGSEEQKQKYLDLARARARPWPRTRRAKPSMGSDVAAMQCRATRDLRRRLGLERHQTVDHERVALELLRDLRDRGPVAKAPRHRGIHRRARAGRRRSPGRHEDNDSASGRATPLSGRPRRMQFASLRPIGPRSPGRASSSPWRPSTRRVPTSGRSRSASCGAASTKCLAYAREQVSPSASRSPSINSSRRCWPRCRSASSASPPFSSARPEHESRPRHPRSAGLVVRQGVRGRRGDADGRRRGAGLRRVRPRLGDLTRSRS